MLQDLAILADPSQPPPGGMRPETSSNPRWLSALRAMCVTIDDQAIVQPGLCDCLMVTHIALSTDPSGSILAKDTPTEKRSAMQWRRLIRSRGDLWLALWQPFVGVTSSLSTTVSQEIAHSY